MELALGAAAARADWVVVGVRTGGPGFGGISLIVVPTDTPGFSVVRRLEKIGWHCSDTAELAFTDCRVPAANLVGMQDSGFVGGGSCVRRPVAPRFYLTAGRLCPLRSSWPPRLLAQREGRRSGRSVVPSACKQSIRPSCGAIPMA